MSVSRKAFIQGCLASLGILGAPALARAKAWSVVRVATEGDFPPYNKTGPDGSIVGFEPDMLQDIAARLKIKIDVVAQDWGGMIPGLADGKYDAVVDAISITPKREETIAFTIPYTSAISGFTSMKDGALASLPGDGQRVTLSDEAAAGPAIDKMVAALKGKVVGVQVSTIQADFLAKYFAATTTIRTFQNGPDTYLDLRSGRVDAVMASTANISAFLKRSNDEAKLTGYTFDGGILGKGTGIGVRKADADLKALLDGALHAAIADGTLKRLSLKWFDIDITPSA